MYVFIVGMLELYSEKLRELTVSIQFNKPPIINILDYNKANFQCMDELFSTGLRYSVVLVKTTKIMGPCLNLGHGYAV